MAAQKGLEVIIKKGDGGAPETFAAIAGLRTKTMTINKDLVDVTSADDTQRWRQLLTGASVRSFSISGGGVLKDDVVTKAMFAASINDTLGNYQVVIPGIGTIEGPFSVSVNIGGEHSAEATYDLALESGGNLTFTPV